MGVGDMSEIQKQLLVIKLASRFAVARLGAGLSADADAVLRLAKKIVRDSEV